MPTVRNMKEFGKMIMDKVKRDLPKAIREYCHKWYGSHPEIKEIVSEEKFISMVNESFKLSINNNKFQAEFGIFKNEDILEEHTEKMNVLWEDFKSDYVNYVMGKITK